MLDHSDHRGDAGGALQGTPRYGLRTPSQESLEDLKVLFAQLAQSIEQGDHCSTGARLEQDIFDLKKCVQTISDYGREWGVCRLTCCLLLCGVQCDIT